MSMWGVLSYIAPLIAHAPLIIGACSVLFFLAWAFPIVRKMAVVAAIVIAAYVAGLGIGNKNGQDYVKDQWSEAEQQMKERGHEARKDAEAAIPLDTTPDPPVIRGGSHGVCLDKWDRDCY
jgi:hypothetical protein